MKSRKYIANKRIFVLELASLARIQRNPLNTRIFDRDKFEQAITHYLTYETPLSIQIDETDLILSGYENFKSAEALGFEPLIAKRSDPPLSLMEKQICLIKDGHHPVAALFGETLQSIH